MATESHQTTSTLADNTKSNNATNTDKQTNDMVQVGNTTPTSSNRSDKHSTSTYFLG
jgi:hypothetical protein